MPSAPHQEKNFEWAALDISSGVKMIETGVKALGLNEGTNVKALPPGLVMTTVDLFPKAENASPSSGPPNFSMSLILSGRVAFEIDGGRRVDVSKPTLVLFASDKPSSGVNYVYPGERFLMLSISCGHEFLQKSGGSHLACFSNELLNDYSVPDQGAYMMTFPLPMKLRGIAEDVMNCRIQNRHAETLFLRSKTLEYLAYIIELSEQDKTFLPSFKEADKLKLSRAKQILEEEFELGWSIASLAKEVGLNEKKLKSGFRHIIGKTVNEYHRTMRMEAAKKMLLDRETVTQVALATGFSSLSHFSKTFRDCYGVLPSEYARCELL